MKLKCVWGFLFVLSVNLQAQEDAKKKIAEKPEATKEGTVTVAAKATIPGKTLAERISYVIGYATGKALRDRYLSSQMNVDSILDGLKAGMAGAEADEKEIDALKVEFRAKLRKDFIEIIKKQPGVKATDSGLCYRVVTPGTGKSPKLTDQVECHYRGSFVDGIEFDSSYKTGKPATFPVQGVIKGWTEALQLMKEGAKWELFIPADLGYGKEGKPPKIPPNATLIFTIELVKQQSRPLYDIKFR